LRRSVSPLARRSSRHSLARRKGQRVGKSNPQAASATIEKKKKAREIDDAYKSALKGIPDNPKTDPWGSMR
jgi:hypothetical protein